MDMHSSQQVESAVAHPVEAEQGHALPSCFSSHSVTCFFCSLFIAMFFAFLCFLLVILLFKMTPSIAPKCCLVFLNTRLICLMEKIHVLDKLCLGMSSSAVGCEFNVNESKYCTSSQRKRKFTNLH